MGMPEIIPGTGTREQAVTDLIESVALQETALSHILNAEGEKMQAIIAMEATPEQLMELNDSVNKLVNAVTRMEMTMQAKLELFSSDTPAVTTTAAEQLANINVTEVTIDVPLNDPAAQALAIAEAIAQAQAQVAPGFTVGFTAAGYDPVTGTLTGTFTVTNDADPLDTAVDAAPRTIDVISTATTAADQLANIDVTEVTIDVPLNDPTAQALAIAEAIAQAQAQVAPGFTVGFTATGYDPVTGTLNGTFTVTNDTNPLDTAIDAAPRAIDVISTATTAADELAKIDVTEVTISVELTDPIAETLAITEAIAQAQAQVAPGYTVGFTATGYDPVTATLSGTFSVTNDTNPLDAAEDAAPRDINVIAQVATAESNAAAQLLGGSLLGVDFSTFTELAAADAQFINGETEGTSVVNDDGINLSVLDATPLNGVLELGVVSQYAEADINGASTASSETASLTLDLMALSTLTPLLTVADLSVGAISSDASFDAATGDSSQDYNIAGAALNLESPLIATAVSALNLAASTASEAIGALGSSVVNGLLDGVNDILGLLNDLLPLDTLGLLSNDLFVDIQVVDLATELAPLLQEPVTSGDGALTLDMDAGTLSIDLSKLTGLNDLPPNTDVLSDTAISSLVADLAEITSALTSKLTDLIVSKLTGTAEVTITGGITLLTIPFTDIPVAGVGIDFEGTLADLLSGASTITLSGTGTLAPFTAFINTLAETVQMVLASVLNPIIDDTILSVVIAAVEGTLTGLTTSLDPVFVLIDSAITIVVNVQNNTADTISETALQLNLLGGAGTLDLATSVAGPNTYALV